MTARKTPDEKLLARIEREMKKYACGNSDDFGYVFPNGSVYFIEEDHGEVAENIMESLKIDCNYREALPYFLSLGIVRISNQGDFCVEAHLPPGSVAENAILDVAAGQKYDMVLVDFYPRYYRQADFLKKKLERGIH